MPNPSKKGLKSKDWTSRLQSLLLFLPLLAALLILLLYGVTLAQVPVFGDPTEYTVVAHELGFAHPPGYAFITLLGKLAQTLVPIGAISWRMHLLAALSATTAALFAFGIIWTIGSALLPNPKSEIRNPKSLAAFFTALLIATGANVWQHAIHANPHIVTATFLLANLFFLTRFWASTNQPTNPPTPTPLFAFAFTLGLGITHHPLTVMAWPAYGLFVLVIRPSIWREWRTLLGMVLCGLLGLTVWLYFPLRAATTPIGPTDLNTLEGFLNYVLARGLSESLPFFGLVDLPNRALVFWTLLRLQYALPVIFLALFGLVWLAMGKRVFAPRRHGGHGDDPEKLRASVVNPFPLFLLYGLAFLGNYAFVMSLRVQDIMAYLLGIFMLVGVLAGIGLLALLTLLQSWLHHSPLPTPHAAFPKEVWLLAAALFLLGPGLQIARNLPRIGLGDYTAAQEYVDAVFERFDGQNEGAVLLNDWEHMTPLWYAQYVDGRSPTPTDVQPVLVSTGTANPWLDNVIRYLPGGPVYLSNYRREIVDFGFRLRPARPFYQVIDIGSELQFTLPEELTAVSATGEQLNLVGYDLPQRAVTAGDYVPLTLAFTAPVTPTDYYVPIVRVGDLDLTFTTDSHQLTPTYTPGEIVVEAFDFALPHDLPAGDYPITVDLKNLSADRTVPLNLSLGSLTVSGQDHPIRTGHLLANFRQQVGLARAVARANGRSATAPWPETALHAQPGDIIHLTLQWQSLAPATESYTIFVHLIDAANRPLVTLDYTPLGGSAPTHLWIPKWLPGQQMLDPYRLPVPPDLPPGTYYIEVGLYEMVNGRRLHMADPAGNLAGDRYILGPVVIEGYK
jgi:hypothetical protein